MPLSPLEQRLLTLVDARRVRLLADLAEHVAIPTGTGWRSGLDRYREMLGARLDGLGARVELRAGAARPAWLELPGGGRNEADGEAPPVLLARRAANAATPRVLIAAHLDTVHDPHGAFRELTIAGDGGTATGPGAADMKGGIVIALHALEVLAEAGVDLSWTMLLNSDEERGSFQSMQVLREAAAGHDIGIATEPALPGGALAVQRMGSAQFRIEVFGRAAHVGRDFASGVSAVNELARVLLAVAELADPARGRIVSVGPLQGGPVVNAVPDYASAWGNMRFVDPATGEELMQRLAALATAPDAMPRVVVHQVLNRPAKPLTDAVQKLVDVVAGAAEDLGQDLPFATTGGVCDGNIMQDAGLPTLDTLGVRGGNLHRTDEFIEVASLAERCALLAVVLARVVQRRKPS